MVQSALAKSERIHRADHFVAADQRGNDQPPMGGTKDKHKKVSNLSGKTVRLPLPKSRSHAQAFAWTRSIAPEAPLSEHFPLFE